MFSKGKSHIIKSTDLSATDFIFSKQSPRYNTTILFYLVHYKIFFLCRPTM